VKVINPCSLVADDFNFEVTLDMAQALSQDMLFRCCFIVDSSNPKTDVELESVDVGNGPGVPVGLMKFEFSSPAPTRAQILQNGMNDGHLEVAGLYLSAVYGDAEFCRVGYYVRHEYPDAAMQESPPEVLDWTRLHRVLSDPCVTRFNVTWDGPPQDPMSIQPQLLQRNSASTWPQPSNIMDVTDADMSITGDKPHF